MDDNTDELYDIDPIIADIDKVDFKKRSRLEIVMLIMFKGSIWFLLPILLIAAILYLVIVMGEEPTGSLLVLCEPDSANIMLNGSLILQKTGQVIEGLQSDNITVSVAKEGFKPEPDHIVIRIIKDDTLVLEFKLNPIPDEPSFEERIAEILPPVKEQTHISAGNKRKSPAVTRPRRAERKIFGSILVSSNIKGAQIFLNGKITGQLTNDSFDSLETGRYVVSVTKDGYQADLDSITVDITRNYQTELLFFNLRPIYQPVRPNITIETIPVAGNIYIDGELVGVGKVSREFVLGRHIVFFGAVKNFRTPPEREIVLTQQNPIENMIVEYSRRLGNASFALVPGKEGQVIEGKNFQLLLDELPYFGPGNGTVDCYLFDNLTAGPHIIKVRFGDAESELKINLEDGNIFTVSFLRERFFTVWKLKLKEEGLMERGDWMKKHKLLNYQQIAGNP